MTSGKGVNDFIKILIKKSVKKGLFSYSQDIVMAFSPPVVGCLVKKGLLKGGGGSRAPQDPPGYAYLRRSAKIINIKIIILIIVFIHTSGEISLM